MPSNWHWHVDAITPSGGPEGGNVVTMTPTFHGDDGMPGDHPGGPLTLLITNPDSMVNFVQGAVVNLSIDF